MTYKPNGNGDRPEQRNQPDKHQAEGGAKCNEENGDHLNANRKRSADGSRGVDDLIYNTGSVPVEFLLIFDQRTGRLPLLMAYS